MSPAGEKPKPDAGALVRDVLAAWQRRERASEGQRIADDEVRNAGAAVSIAVREAHVLLPDDGPLERHFAADGWTVTLRRARRDSPVEATCSKSVPTEPV